MKSKIIRIFYEILKTISRDNCARYFKNHYQQEYNELICMTSFLDKFDDNSDKNKKISIFERIYCIEHDMSDRPKCRCCNTHYVCGFNKQKNEYRQWCSANCQASDKKCIMASKATRLTRYGDANYHGVEKARITRETKNDGKWHSDDFGEKVKNGKRANGHDVNWVNVSKSKATRLKNYGDKNFNNKEKNKTTRKTNFYNTLIENENVIPLFSIEKYIKEDKHSIFTWKCKKCGTEFKQKINYNFKCHGHNGIYARCPVCFPYETTAKSEAETEMFNFIKELDATSIQSDRSIISPLELDVVCKTHKLAFELDGLYWHSDENKNNNYHYDKTKKCADVGFQLIHVFENEWMYKKEIVKSRISNLLGIYENTVFARKCEIKEIAKNESYAFQEKNHIQGGVNSKINIGLYFNNELISLMTFDKSRFSKKYEWELTRFCNKLGYHIPGAASKLLKYFEKTYHPKSIISYADMRWSIGKMYIALGFILDHMSKPNYWYFKYRDHTLYSRIKFQKHKLKTILNSFDKNKTEIENMKANGYLRIFDCGNMVFIKTY